MQMTQELTVFKFNEHVIRRVPGKDGRIFYCIADICAALGIKKTNEVVKRLNKGAINNASLSANGGVNNASLPGSVIYIEYPTAGGMQRMVFTDEVGLYDIISKSRKSISKMLYRRLIEAVPPMRQKPETIEIAHTNVPDLVSIRTIAQSIIGITDHIEALETDVCVAKRDIAFLKAAQEVKALLPPVPPLTRRNEIILFINKYMAKYPSQFNDFEDIWNYLYDAFRLRTRRDIKREARASRYMSVLAYVQSVGEIDRLWVVARDLFDK